MRLLSGIIGSLDLSSLRKLYKERGRSPYDPKMLLAVVIYAYMNNIYSCRRIEKSLKRDIHFIWLAGYEQPDFVTINRFRNRVKKEVNAVFTQVVLLLAERGFVSLDVEYIDGTKIESKANKYTFVWRKTVEKNRAKLLAKIKVLLSQIDDVIAQDNASEQEKVEFTPELLHSMARELNAALAEEPEPATKAGKNERKARQKQVRELEEKAEKLAEYDRHLDTLGERNSYSKTDPDATFMRRKEDAMNNGQTKPGYNIQISTENQFITHYSSSWRPTDFGTLIPHLDAFERRYNRQSAKICADSGYGNEQNYEYMEANGIEGFVKYNMFHAEQKRKSVNNPFLPEHMFYNAEGDYYVCPMGQHLEHSSDSKKTTDLGYEYTTSTYMARDCSRCPLRGSCYRAKSGRRTIEVNHRNNELKAKARERLMSEEGLKHRSRRPVEPEAVFGQIKYDGGFRRFHYRSKELVEAEFATLATAHNIRKMASIINAERSRQAAVTSRKACPPSDTLEGGARRMQVIA